MAAQDGSVQYSNLHKASRAWVQKQEVELLADGSGRFVDARGARQYQAASEKESASQGQASLR